MTTTSEPRPIDMWGPTAFPAFWEQNQKPTPEFKTALREFWESYCSASSPFDDYSLFCGLGPSVPDLDDAADRAIVERLLPKANPNNPVDVFMLCNAAVRLECGPNFYEKPENQTIEGIAGTCSDRAALVFRKLAQAPQAQGTVLGATLREVLKPDFHMQHMDFIPDVSRRFDREFWDFM
jgi:hypothetical protein